MEPYVLHTTYVYGQQEGKKARMRDNGLWLADPPAYFSGPKFMSMDILPPPVRFLTPHNPVMSTGPALRNEACSWMLASLPVGLTRYPRTHPSTSLS